jgi:hypothetical protein
MSASWTCARCGVTTSFGPGSPARSHPEGWAQLDGEWACLGCRRAEVAETASAGEERGRSARRRQALTEFELLRDPAAPDQVIAKRVRCATAMVRPVRASLQEQGKLPT